MVLQIEIDFFSILSGPIGQSLGVVDPDEKDTKDGDVFSRR
jgi:hypothetical protein